MDREKISAILRELREKKGETQQEVADALGISVSAVNAYENGERIPRDEVKIALARYFNKPVQKIFFT